MTETPTVHKRRVRYRGTHPRRFEEKYKELDPARYQRELEKVMARGQTPAGTHRPIMVDEILAALAPKPGETALDATLGYGGHTQEILKRLQPGGRLFGLDVDPRELPRTEERLRSLGFDETTLIVRRMNFAGVAQLLPETDGGFDLILADLGVSSMQIDNPARGFTYKAEGPLDLRLNPDRGEPASALLRKLDREQLQELLLVNSDEIHAHAIARRVASRQGSINTTGELATAVREALVALPKSVREAETKKILARVFQALRIAVNDEFGVLDQFLALAPKCMRAGGRLAILTFHSGEDRRVKKAFQDGLLNGIYSSISPEPLRPSREERRSNPRSTCAKLRWAVRTGTSSADAPEIR